MQSIIAIIPTGNRKEDYISIIDWCKERRIDTLTITTSKQSEEYAIDMKISDNSLNISKWWNIGLSYAYSHYYKTVLVLNDDVILTDFWLKKILKSLKGRSGASGARRGICIQGYAFALNAEDCILADEELAWWHTDDAIQKRCEEKNGFALVQGLRAINKYANSTASRFAEQIKKDRILFQERYVINWDRNPHTYRRWRLKDQTLHFIVSRMKKAVRRLLGS